MSVFIAEKDLPQQLTPEQAVEAAYSHDLAQIASDVQRGLPALVECEKDLAPYLFINIRARLKQHDLRCLYLDGRPREGQQVDPMAGFIGTMVAQLREAVRGAVEKRVVVLPHLDLLTTSQGGLTTEAKEVIPLLYENPELVWLGFKDPSFSLPQVIENLFPHRYSLLGVPRPRLRHLVTQKESRKFGKEFSPWALYKYVSGMNAVRLRKLLSTLDTEDYPADPRAAYAQIRQATMSGTLEVPNVDLERDIGGYDKVKKRLSSEILNVLAYKDQKTNPEEIQRLEELIPKGMIFWGPPGTGKTLFAKAMATAIGAAITVVSGPELKSKWVGESLPYDEEVLVTINGEVRRIAIGELVENHSHNDVRTWTMRDDGTATFARVTGFLRHEGPNYVDVLVTETGRQVRITGGHSLFVEKDGRLAEVFAEEVVPGETRIAIPLRLTAPQTVRELNLLELLADQEGVHVQGYEVLVPQIIEHLGRAYIEPTGGVAINRLASKQKPPLTITAFRRLMDNARINYDPNNLMLYRWHRKKCLPAIMPLTEELGEFFGKWAADGCYATTGVRLAVHESEVDHYRSLCERLFGHATIYRKKQPNGKGTDLYICNFLLRTVMQEGLKLSDGSANKRVPSIIFLAPLPVVAAFLRGYFSGDGAFSRKFIEATTVSRGLAEDVMTLLQYFGIVARCRLTPERKGAMAYRVRFLWTGFLRRFVEQIGFTDARRNDAVWDYLNNLGLRRDKQTPACHITNDVLWDKVVEKKREPYRRKHVYDLSVAKTERFIAGLGNILVHNSEQNLRQVFHRARQSAPSIIVFDELDSFASARGTYTGSGVEHSMVNQLLTEMDGFHREEMVFVVGTTNFVEALDPALLRPGRFEFLLHIPHPNSEDRRAILNIYNQKMRLALTESGLEYAVKRTGEFVEGAAVGTRFTGDHINALCRAMARIRLREQMEGPSDESLVERALTEWVERPKMTPAEERVVATHESGHAVCSMFCTHATPIERISIQSDIAGALGYVRHQEHAHRYVVTRGRLLDDLCVLMGGREAELLLMDDLSIGCAGDLERATEIARALVEEFGMGGDEVGIGRFPTRSREEGETRQYSPEQLAALDRSVRRILEDARQRAAAILAEHRSLVETLRDLLLEKKVIDAKTLETIVTPTN